jgi:hypothetical protein
VSGARITGSEMQSTAVVGKYQRIAQAASLWLVFCPMVPLIEQTTLFLRTMVGSFIRNRKMLTGLAWGSLVVAVIRPLQADVK